MTTAFVLGGGGVLGAAEVGMLRALFEAEITPDLVVGTSVGALNGAMVARDPTAAVIDRLTELWQDAQTLRTGSDRSLRTVGRVRYSKAPSQRRTRVARQHCRHPVIDNRGWSIHVRTDPKLFRAPISTSIRTG